MFTSLFKFKKMYPSNPLSTSDVSTSTTYQQFVTIIIQLCIEFVVIEMRLRPFCSRRFQSPCQSSAIKNMSSECCDVIVAHSPPIFTAHNAQPELSVLYQNWLVISQKQQSPLAVRRYNARSSNSPTREDKPAVQIKTRRPCLVIRTDSDGSIGSSSSSSSDENEPSSPTRRKKKVVFADDRGLSLTQVSDTILLLLLFI